MFCCTPSGDGGATGVVATEREIGDTPINAAVDIESTNARRMITTMQKAIPFFSQKSEKPIFFENN
jgi:hypothetical protein